MSRTSNSGAAGGFKRPRSDQAASFLRERILSGELAAGAKLRLSEIADELGMSAIPVREALRVLSAEGLVDARAQHGFRVSPVDRSDMEQTYRLRALLEPMAVVESVPRISGTEAFRAEELLALAEKAFVAGDWSTHQALHREFHRVMYASCESRMLLRIVDMLAMYSNRYSVMSATRKRANRISEHREMLVAIQRRDGDRAGKLQMAHILKTVELVEPLLEME